LYDTLRPEAAATGRELIAKTIFFIRFRQIAAAAKRARGKSKTLYLLPVGHIFFI
jgi:hypothetical protein